MQKFRRVAVWLIAACLLPFAAVLVGDGLAAVAVCQGGASVCRLAGLDIAPVLRALASGGWLGLPLLAVAGAVVLFWGLAEAARLMGEARAGTKKAKPRD